MQITNGAVYGEYATELLYKSARKCDTEKCELVIRKRQKTTDVHKKCDEYV